MKVKRQEERMGRAAEKKEFDERVIEVARVTRVTAGGKRMRFRAAVVVGDKNGRVGFAAADGVDVESAVGKGARRAKKNLVRVPILDGTIPHNVRAKYVSARILIKPAPPGTGIKAGGAMRVVLEYAGIPNVSGKQLGSSNKISNARATLLALGQLRLPAQTVKKEDESSSQK